ncbi:MAG: IS66 family insertion sequence element accessory protein TnpB, partial [Planctomycetota bacterium]
AAGRDGGGVGAAAPRLGLVIGPGAGTRIYIRCGVTDLRKAFDGLTRIVEEELGRSITDGDFIVFCNRARNRLKAIYWDGSGVCLFAKRLEGGRFAWPSSKKASEEITAAELSMLLEGIDFRNATHRVWYRRRPVGEKVAEGAKLALTT